MEKFFELPQFLCLEGLVGISQKTCECMETVAPSKVSLVRDSETGLYVDEHDGAVGCLFLEKSKCGDGDIWDKLIMARREAVLQMIIDSSVHLEDRYATIRPYNHHIGELGYSTLLNLTTGTQSVKFTTKKLTGAKILINGLGLLAKILTTNSFETVRITFKNKTKNVVLKVIDFDVKMSVGLYSQTADATMYDMPTITMNCDGSEYEISYEYDSTKLLIYDNDLTCRCGGVRSELSKYYEKLPDGKALGLLLNASYVCDENYLLCALANSVPTVRFLIAEGIRCLTMCKFLNNSKSQASHGASIENVLNTSGLDDLIGAFSMKYQQALEDIKTKVYGMPNFGCFTCNTSQHSSRGMIQVTDPFMDANKNLTEIYKEINNRNRISNPFWI